jgi:hypothetical protein
MDYTLIMFWGGALLSIVSFSLVVISTRKAKGPGEACCPKQ